MSQDGQSIFSAPPVTHYADGRHIISEVIWGAISDDYQWLEKYSQETKLIDRPLWLSDVRGDEKFFANFPVWIREPFDAFVGSEWVSSGPWGVIISWYRSILPNNITAMPTSLFGEKADIEIAGQPDRFWTITDGRSADKILEDIRRIADGRDTVFSDDSSPIRNSVDLESGEKPSALYSESSDSADVSTLADHPTAEDALGRRSFAQALANRLDDILKAGGKDGFAVNLHAPWGAGKTSILMMMEAFLCDPKRQLGDRWAVVNFNAWDHEKRNPPWWPLIEATKDGCVKSLEETEGRARADDIKNIWRDWIFRAEWWPLVVGSLMLLTTIIAYVLIPQGQIRNVVAFLGILITVFGGSQLFIRKAFFGSMSNEEFYVKIAKDPMRKISELFQEIVDATDMPVCIFIDDLDRCNVDFVVDLLVGIQTSFRNPKVAYVVAADKAWIRSSFESRYASFNDEIGDAGQPLGYLFLEKIFQMSVPVPGMGDWKRRYFESLLHGTAVNQGNEDAVEPKTEQGVSDNRLSQRAEKARDEEVQKRRQEIRDAQGGDIRQAGIDAALQDRDDDITRAALVLEYTASKVAQQETEHLLARFTTLLPDNPRVMKRMINAFGMRYAISLLERSDVPREALARWTVLEQRFPALADLLVEHPDWTDDLASPDKSENYPEVLDPFLLTPAVQNILAGELNPGGDISGPRSKLDAEAVRKITRGSAD